MEIHKLDTDFNKDDIVEPFESVIWTDRYYGDGDAEIIVEPSNEMVNLLAEDTILSVDDSDEFMIVETLDIQNGMLKASAISLTQWLNNRFFRTTWDPAIKEIDISSIKPGEVISDVVYNACCSGSPYLLDDMFVGIPSWPDDYHLEPNWIGINNPSTFALPGLIRGAIYTGGSSIAIKVPFGRVYDIIKPIAEAYQIGMKIAMGAFSPGEYFNLEFSTFVGADRTSDQDFNPVIRFSPDLETLTNVKELRSTQGMVDLVYTYPTQVNRYVATLSDGVPVTAQPPGYVKTGWKLRVAMEFDDTIKPEDVSDPPIPLSEEPHADAPWGGFPIAQHNELKNKLAPGQVLYLKDHKRVQVVDGEIVPTGEFQYGIHYFMGDIIEIEGYSGIRQKARVTEYIRSQDATGKTAYPAVTIIDE